MRNRLTIVLILLIVLVIIVFVTFEKAKKDDDALARSLYSSISVLGYDYHTDITTVLYAKDMASELKNYYGYKNLDAVYIQKDLCSNYPNQKNNSGLIGNFYCGNRLDFDDYSEMETKTILSKDLKKSVESIFGIGSYEPTSFTENIHLSTKYIYDETTDTYVLVSIYGSTAGPKTEYSFVSYTKTDDSIIIVESSKEYNSSTGEYIDNANQYEITFKLGSSTSYILYSIERITE